MTRNPDEKERHRNPVTGVILAGGLGTRLRPLVSDCPKALVEINGRPFITYLLDQMRSAGITRVTLCTGYLGDQIEERLGAVYNGLDLVYSHEPSRLDTAGAIRLGLSLIQADDALVMNGDSLCHTDLKPFISWRRTLGPFPALLLTQVPDTTRYGRVEMDADGKIVSFSEKGQYSGSGWINAGVYMLPVSIIERIPEGRPVSLERDMFPVWTVDGLYGYRATAPFIDIGTPETCLAAGQFIAGLASSLDRSVRTAP